MVISKQEKTIEIARAKRDYHNTLMTFSGTILVAASIGYWTFYQKNFSAEISMVTLTVISAVIFLYSWCMYHKRHEDFINELRK